MNDHGLYHRSAFVLAFGQAFAVAREVARHGPSWEIMPGLLSGLAALVMAVLAWRRFDLDRKHSEELHAIKVRAQLEAMGACEKP
jgi:hypothetical protein